MGRLGMAGAGRPPPGTGGHDRATAGAGARLMLPPGEGGPVCPILHNKLHTIISKLEHYGIPMGSISLLNFCDRKTDAAVW